MAVTLERERIRAPDSLKFLNSMAGVLSFATWFATFPSLLICVDALLRRPGKAVFSAEARLGQWLTTALIVFEVFLTLIPIIYHIEFAHDLRRSCTPQQLKDRRNEFRFYYVICEIQLIIMWLAPLQVHLRDGQGFVPKCPKPLGQGQITYCDDFDGTSFITGLYMILHLVMLGIASAIAMNLHFLIRRSTEEKKPLLKNAPKENHLYQTFENQGPVRSFSHDDLAPDFYNHRPLRLFEDGQKYRSCGKYSPPRLSKDDDPYKAFEDGGRLEENEAEDGDLGADYGGW